MNVAIALINPIYEGNVGAVARLMANFGVSKLYLIEPCDIGKEAMRRARKGKEILENASVISKLPEYDTIITTTGVTGGETNILRSPTLLSSITPKWMENAGSTLLVFGREDHGLSNEELDKGDLVVHIEASHEYPVLNLSHSVGILLHHLYTLKHSHGGGASREQKDAFIQVLQDVQSMLDNTETCDENQIRVFKTLLSKGVSEKECNILFGLLRSIQDEL